MILFGDTLPSIIFKGVILSIVCQDVIAQAYPYSSAPAAAAVAAPSAGGATATAGGPATGFSSPGIGGPTGGVTGGGSGPGPGPSAGGPTGPVGPSGPPTGPVGGTGPGPTGPVGGSGPSGPVGPGSFGPTGPIGGPGGPGAFGFGPSGPVGFGPGPGAFGPGPGAFGPGPFGPGPFGPGPFGAAPFGPGPYGPFYRWLAGLANYWPGLLKYKAFGAKALKSNFLGKFPPFNFPPYPYPVPYGYPGHVNPLLFPYSFKNKALALVQKHYTKFVEPVLMGVLGALGMWIFRTMVLPKLPIIVKKEVARSLDKNENGAIETLADSVTSAISRGICLQHIACEFGLMVRPLPAQVIETLRKNSSPNSGLEHFIKVANSTEITSCEAYRCRNEEQTHLGNSSDHFTHFTSDNSVLYDAKKK